MEVCLAEHKKIFPLVFAEFLEGEGLAIAYDCKTAEKVRLVEIFLCRPLFSHSFPLKKRGNQLRCSFVFCQIPLRETEPTSQSSRMLEWVTKSLFCFRDYPLANYDLHEGDCISDATYKLQSHKMYITARFRTNQLDYAYSFMTILILAEIIDCHRHWVLWKSNPNLFRSQIETTCLSW